MIRFDVVFNDGIFGYQEDLPMSAIVKLTPNKSWRHATR
jgi:hypothetical protein